MEFQTNFREAMSRLAGVVNVITTGRGDARCGLTATAMCSLSAEPPSVLVCINASASAHNTILAEGRFGVNVLSPEQAWIANRFAGQDGRKGAVRFEGAVWHQTADGAPLLSDALVALDCRIAQRFDGYSHSILVGVIESIHLSDDPRACLVWQGRTYRQTANVVEPSQHALAA
ncbi:MULTISPECIES: flavin reductase family protein [unclassified Caballeronia]|uniref:flavin reductase family protein n=1 Tax=unclassified Caballeronia TaxID=2646786 RepID=UPI001F40AE6D|nr:MULTISPECIES: flavin reductase family protein [unclassified Caballeronia]MCE4547613.1 flavin reductase family protein [Caballeronia sp. PC1]MCE4575071.1 flavin reductase family protein [Caballeronia sp. CLC5]